MINKIYLITPYSSQYGALHYFTQKLCEAWAKAGFDAHYFMDAEAALEASLKNLPDLVIGFNGIPQKDEKYYCDIIKRPYLTLLVDPFFRFLDVTSSPYVIVGCDDFSGCISLKRLNFQNALFVPHAIESNLCPDPHVERIYDVTMLATFIDYESRRNSWKSTYPAYICKMMDEVVERTFADPQLPFVDATLSQMQSFRQQHPEIESVEMNSLDIFRDIEVYIKGKERIELLKSIQTAPVHVFGDSVDPMDWKKYFAKQSNIIVHDPVSYEKSLDILKRSKIVLNSSIKNKFGAHERIFASLAAGALSLTNENIYLKKYFTHDVDIAFFQYDQLNQINRIIHTYLSDEEKLQQVVENGRDIVMNYHTWDARIKTFKEELFPLVEKIQSLGLP